MSTVAITGAAGFIGRQLLEELSRSGGVERIVAIDVSGASASPSPKVDSRDVDIRDPSLADHFAGCDAVVHLAYQMDPIRDERSMREINVDGARNVFGAAAKAGVAHVVYMSSAVVYGANPDNDFPLTETSAIRATPSFGYSQHKVEVEEWLLGWRDRHPDVAVAVLRPAIVSGTGAQNFMTRQMEYPRFVTVRGHRPPLQLVHVEDVVSAVILALEERLDGAFNVASEGWLSYDEAIAISGVKTVDLPEEMAFALADRVWKLGFRDAPPGQVNYLMHPWVVSAEKLLAAGWRPKHSNRDALAELVDEHRQFVTVGPVRARRRDVRIGAAATSASLLALVYVVRRRRR